MNNNKYLFMLIGIITFFVFLVSSLSMYVQENYTVSQSCGCDVPIYLVLIAFASFGLFVGSFTYYFHRKYTDDKKDYIGKNVFRTLDFLNQEDKKIVLSLIKENEVLQSKLGKITGLDSVKLHRRVKFLESKNIIRRERKGMSYKIYLNKELKVLFE